MSSWLHSLSSSSIAAECELLVVALLWGATNPALNRTSAKKNKANDKRGNSRDKSSSVQIKETSDSTTISSEPDSSSPPTIFSLLSNIPFLLLFGLNQLGSIVNMHALSKLDVSFAVPTVNALTMVVTAVSAWAMGEKQVINKRVMVGLLLLLCGISLCVISRH